MVFISAAQQTLTTRDLRIYIRCDLTWMPVLNLKKYKQQRWSKFLLWQAILQFSSIRFVGRKFYNSVVLKK